MDSSPAKKKKFARRSYYRKIKRLKEAAKVSPMTISANNTQSEEAECSLQGTKLLRQSGFDVTDKHACPLQTVDTTSETTKLETNEDEAIIVPEADLMIAALATKHNWSFECVQDVCKTIRRFGDTMKNIRTTKEGIVKTLGLNLWNTEYGWVCQSCNVAFYSNLFENPMSSIICTCNNKPHRGSDHYIIFDIEIILKNVLPSIVSSAAETVHDKFFKEKLLQQIAGATLNDFTLCLNTDGVPLFKSSKFSLWPVLATVNVGNLKQQRKNTLLLGLWSGKDKPDFQHFLKTILQKLKNLSDVGIQWKPLNGSLLTSRVYVSFVMCDSIARPLVQGTSQFNAIYGCNFCYHKSDKVDGFTSHFYKHTTFLDNRTMTSMLVDLKNLKAKQDSRGVKRESPFLELPYFNLVLGFPPDVMHCCYLGVAKQFTNTWFNSNNHLLPYYLGSKLKSHQIDELLLAIRPPNRINRCPRSLENRKFFKAHEWQAWLLYYSPVVLLEQLPKKYYYHWLLLVEGIAILTSEYINENDIRRAENLLFDFSEQVEKLYDMTQCTYNVHLLRHLGQFVKYYGPLQYISMYAFENYNQRILKYVSGSQFVSYQVAKRYLQELVVNFNTRNLSQTDFAHFLKSLNSVGTPNSKKVDIKLGYLHGKCPDFNVNWNIIDYYNQNGAIYFKKLKRTEGTEYYSKSCVECKTRNNCCVRVDYNLIIEIELFLYMPSTTESFAVGMLHSVNNSSAPAFKYCDISVGCTKGLVATSDLKEIVLKINSGNRVYFLSFLNYVDNNNNQ